MSNGKRSHTGAAFRRPHFGGNRIQGVILPGFHFPSPSFASAAGLLGEFCCPKRPRTILTLMGQPWRRGALLAACRQSRSSPHHGTDAHSLAPFPAGRDAGKGASWPLHGTDARSHASQCQCSLSGRLRHRRAFVAPARHRRAQFLTRRWQPSTSWT
jgi:hypothetical protein